MITHIQKTIILLAAALLVAGCRRASAPTTVIVPDEPETRPIEPNSEAMRRLEGIWVDGETDAVLFQVRGDSIFYPDITSLPARFLIFDDTLLILGANNIRYPIRKQGDNIFDYVNLQGDVVHLRRSDDDNDSLFFNKESMAPIVMGELVKRDTVVFAPSGRRLHLYIDINPTTRKVFKTSYTDEGMAVQNVYYDNIIHISVYDGREKLFSRDIEKHSFEDIIPKEFIGGAILSNMAFGKTNNSTTRFIATVSEPEGTRSYVVMLNIGLDGSMTAELTE